jgi:ferrochelatase
MNAVDTKPRAGTAQSQRIVQRVTPGRGDCHPMPMITPPTTAGASTGNPAHSPVDAGTALVLVNLGTPDAPTPGAVRRYLGEFLSDRRVVDLPRWRWWPVLNLLILPLRSRRVAHKYASIWMEGGSPLAAYTRGLAQAVQRDCPQWRVLPAMRYGAPALADALRQLRADGVERVVVLPLYPQYSTTTTASVRDVVEAAGFAIQDRGFVEAGKTGAPTLAGAPLAHFVGDYHLDPGWIGAIAESIRAHRAQHGNAAHLLFSVHGLPQRLADNGDPYPRQCEAGARAIAAALGLRDESWTLTYQSRFGREKWLEPATADTLEALAERVQSRGCSLRYIPCLNATPAHADALAALAQRELAAW